jgi:hypothetical protein
MTSYIGILGILICLAASAGRFYGAKQFLGFQAINIFIVGVGLLVTACWARLEADAAAKS